MRPGVEELVGSEALLSERFRIVSRLGEGAFGTVYEALDLARGERVAVKVLHRVSGDSIFRFKQEFRALRDLRHPNLVELGELIENRGRWLFTMELVRGPDVLSYVRGSRAQAQGAEPRRGLDEGRVRDVLGQLAAGLSALHHAGRIHRDIKPSNVRVTEEGRLVLLDFGLIKRSEDDSGSAAASMVGTAAYMSPEQAAARTLTPASDWYSVGVLLYEALTGRRPFTGSPLQILFDKQRQQPAPPSVLVHSVAKDLESLCMALLEIDPEARPSGDEVLRRVGSTASLGRFGAPHAFIGRVAELRQLHEAVDALVAGSPSHHFYVAGESGVGKSRLLSEWTVQLQAVYPRALVLRGGCHEAESVPFRAFDGVVDALSRHLRQLSAAELEALLPPHVGALPNVFPVLARVELIGRESVGYESAADPWAARNDAFNALRHVFARLGEQRPVVVVLDDLQWADAESLQLIERILTPPEPPRLLVVGSGAMVERCPSTLRQLLELTLCPRGQGVLTLGGLPLDEASQYASALLAKEGSGWPSPPPPDLPRKLAERAEGHPVFIDFLVRHGHGVGLPDGEVPTLEWALRHRVALFSAAEHDLLVLLAVAGGPLRLSILRDAVGLKGQRFSECVSALVASVLVEQEGVGEDASLVIVQERLREAVLAELASADRVRAHRRLADAYLSVGAQDAEALAIHLSSAGDVDSAVHFAVIAAGAAFDAFAFERASRLYRLALDLLPPQDERRRRRTWARYADALAGAGRGREAARAYLHAMEGANPLEAAELRTRAAQQMMQCGDVLEALGHIRDLLRAIGQRFPQSQAGALASFLFQRARLRLRGMAFEPRGATWIAPEQLQEIDLLWSVSSIVTMSDIVRGADFQTRHVIKALDAGEPYRLARAMAMEAQFLQSLEPRPDPRVSELFAQARLLAEESGNPHAHAVVSLSEGAAANSTGRFGQALAKLEEAESTLRRRCRGATWEIDTAQYISTTVLMFMGRFGELARRVPRLLAEAHERGDHYLETLLSMSAGYWPYLFRGDAQGARDCIERSVGAWRRANFQSQDLVVCISSTYVALCAEPESAAEVFEKHYACVDERTVARVPTLRVLLGTLRAQAELASVMHGRRLPGADPWGAARRVAQALSREALGYAPAFGALIAAAVASHKGDSMRAVSLLTEAAAGFQAHEMGLYAWATRYREGQLIGGEQGREQVARALSWVREQGILAPVPLLEAASPGFPVD